MTTLPKLDTREIERRKERIRKAWRYEPVDHLPLAFVLDDFRCYSVRELCLDGRLQFEMNVANISRLWRLLPDDYLPVARVWPGYITIATMFGLQPHWSDDPNQPPGVTEPLIHEIGQVHDLRAPDPMTAGLMPFNLHWLRYHAEHLPPEVLLTGIDLGGPLNTAKDLFATNLLYTAFYDYPEELHAFFRLATEVQIGCYREIVAAAGGLDRLTCIDFDPVWAPEGRKGFVSDDVCAALSPGVFKTFSRPWNNLIFQQWPGGRLHNCGPHPAIDLYLDHEPAINGLNCSYRYTRGDLPRIKAAFRGRGIVELGLDNATTPADLVRDYTQIAEALAPDVVAIAVIGFDASWSDDDIRALYAELLPIARRYAAAMDWAPAVAPRRGRPGSGSR